MSYTPEQLQADLQAFKAALQGELLTKSEIAAQLSAIEAKIVSYDDTVLKTELANLKEQFNLVNARLAAQQTKPTETVKKSFEQAFGDALLEKSDNIAKLARGEKNSSFDFELSLKDVSDITTGNVTGGTVWGAVYRPGIIEDPKRKVHMRQILRGGTIGSGTDYYFMKQNGNGEGSIAPTAETSTKPQFDEDLVESSVKIETIAGWERVSRKAMMNVPGLVSFLQSRMIEKLYKVEDAQTLYGNGTSPNLKGILATGNFTPSGALITLPLVEKLVADISLLEDTYDRSANGILLRPSDYYALFMNKATGSGEFDLPPNVQIVNGQVFVAGIPVFATTALNTNDYIVGDWSGANFLTQEAMRIEFFEQDGDNVRNNKVTIRIEESVALPVYGSTYFIKGTSATSE